MHKFVAKALCGKKQKLKQTHINNENGWRWELWSPFFSFHQIHSLFLSAKDVCIHSQLRNRSETFLAKRQSSNENLTKIYIQKEKKRICINGIRWRLFSLNIDNKTGRLNDEINALKEFSKGSLCQILRRIPI